MDKNLTFAHVEYKLYIIEYKRKIDKIKVLKHTPKINADILKDKYYCSVGFI